MKATVKKCAEYLNRKFHTREGVGVLITVCCHPEEPYLEFLMDNDFREKYRTDTLQVNFSKDFMQLKICWASYIIRNGKRGIHCRTERFH